MAGGAGRDAGWWRWKWAEAPTDPVRDGNTHTHANTHTNTHTHTHTHANTHAHTRAHVQNTPGV